MKKFFIHYNCNFSFCSQGNIGQYDCIFLKVMRRATKWKQKTKCRLWSGGSYVLCVPLHTCEQNATALHWFVVWKWDNVWSIGRTCWIRCIHEQNREARDVMALWVSKGWVLSRCPWLRGSWMQWWRTNGWEHLLMQPFNVFTVYNYLSLQQFSLLVMESTHMLPSNWLPRDEGFDFLIKASVFTVHSPYNVMY